MSLTKMFTIGIPESSHGPEPKDYSPVLIFHDESGIKDFLAEAEKLRSDPYVQGVFPHGGTIRPCSELDPDKDILIAGDLSDEVLPLMGEAGNVVIWDAAGVRVIDTYETFYACKLPVRTFMGCAECVSLFTKDDDTSRFCPVAQQVHHGNVSDEEAPTVGDVAEISKSRKLVVQGYTYVSPRLTTSLAQDYYHSYRRESWAPRNSWRDHGTFTRTYRPAKWHDFSLVEDRSQEIRLALKERHRRVAFKANVCPGCTARQACGRQDFRHCSGAYTQSIAEMEHTILKGTNWLVWEDWQIRFILAESGSQDARVNRRKMFLTFNASGEVELRFARTRNSPRHNVHATYRNWSEFHSYFLELDVEQARVHWCQKQPPLEVGVRGALATAAGIECSPRTGWGGGRYPTLGITARLSYDGTYEFQCIWSQGRHPPTHYPVVTIQNITDIYTTWRYIPGVEKTRGEHSPVRRRTW